MEFAVFFAPNILEYLLLCFLWAPRKPGFHQFGAGPNLGPSCPVQIRKLAFGGADRVKITPRNLIMSADLDTVITIAESMIREAAGELPSIDLVSDDAVVTAAE